MSLLLLYSLALRFFLFEFKTFEKLRVALKKFSLVKIFLECPFCNGFWCGLFLYAIFIGFTIEMIFFGFSVGFLSFILYLVTTKLIQDVYK